MITNEELTNILLQYREGKISKPLFHKCLYKIAKEINKRWNLSDDVIREVADVCINKSDRFDINRGKTMNFFYYNN